MHLDNTLTLNAPYLKICFDLIFINKSFGLLFSLKYTLIMEFRMTKVQKTILRPAQKIFQHGSNPSQSSANPSHAVVTTESIKFISLEVCNICNLVFKDSPALSSHKSLIHSKS